MKSPDSSVFTHSTFHSFKDHVPTPFPLLRRNTDSEWNVPMNPMKSFGKICKYLPALLPQFCFQPLLWQLPSFLRRLRRTNFQTRVLHNGFPILHSRIGRFLRAWVFQSLSLFWFKFWHSCYIVSCCFAVKYWHVHVVLSNFEKHRFRLHDKQSLMMKVTFGSFLTTVAYLFVYLSTPTVGSYYSEVTSSSVIIPKGIINGIPVIVESSTFYSSLFFVTCTSIASNTIKDALLYFWHALMRWYKVRTSVTQE